MAQPSFLRPSLPRFRSLTSVRFLLLTHRFQAYIHQNAATLDKPRSDARRGFSPGSHADIEQAGDLNVVVWNPSFAPRKKQKFEINPPFLVGHLAHVAGGEPVPGVKLEGWGVLHAEALAGCGFGFRVLGVSHHAEWHFGHCRGRSRRLGYHSWSHRRQCHWGSTS